MTKSIPHFLPVLALLCALTLGPPSGGVRATVAALFVPVSMPARAAMQGVHDRVVSPAERFNLQGGPATLDEALYENRLLQSKLTNVESQLEDLQKVFQQYRTLAAALQSKVEPATVLAGPSDARQTLTIATTGLTRVEEKMAVVHPLGVVGRISGVSPAGTARVILATDPAFKADVRFVGLVREGDRVESVPRPMPAAMLAEGAPREKDVQGTTGQLVARYLPAKAVRQSLRVGDAVVLDDAEWPPVTRGLRLGTVAAIDLPPTDANYASVRITPVADLATLREVLVVNK